MDSGDPWNPRSETVANVMAMLRQVHRVLRPNGIFISITFGQVIGGSLSSLPFLSWTVIYFLLNCNVSTSSSSILEWEENKISCLAPACFSRIFVVLSLIIQNLLGLLSGEHLVTDFTISSIS